MNNQFSINDFCGIQFDDRTNTAIGNAVFPLDTAIDEYDFIFFNGPPIKGALLHQGNWILDIYWHPRLVIPAQNVYIGRLPNSLAWQLDIHLNHTDMFRAWSNFDSNTLDWEGITNAAIRGGVRGRSDVHFEGMELYNPYSTEEYWDRIPIRKRPSTSLQPFEDD